MNLMSTRPPVKMTMKTCLSPKKKPQKLKCTNKNFTTNFTNQIVYFPINHLKKKTLKKLRPR